MAVLGQTRMLNAPAVSKSLVFFLFYFEFSLGEWGSQNKQQNSTVTALKHLKRLGPTASPQTHANVKRTGSFPDTAEEYAPDVSLQGRIPRSAGTPCNSFCFPRRRANHRALESDALP